MNSDSARNKQRAPATNNRHNIPPPPPPTYPETHQLGQGGLRMGWLAFSSGSRGACPASAGVAWSIQGQS
jgi:hypothetical protein